MRIGCDRCGMLYDADDDTIVSSNVKYFGEQNDYHLCPSCARILRDFIKDNIPLLFDGKEQKSYLADKKIMNYNSELKHSSEILSIIEGGLEGNAKKVRAYTELLVDKLPDNDHMKHVIKRRLDGSYKNDPILEGKKPCRNSYLYKMFKKRITRI
jgi:hypothetical protein